MDKATFTFDLVDKLTPDIVIKDALKQIGEATKGYVIGNIEEYEGQIHTYTKTVGLESTLNNLIGQEKITYNIQDKLGELIEEQDKKSHRYEVFLTVKWLEHYKYRMMFVDYGAVSYPVTIVMNKKLALEYSGKWNDTFYIDSMKKLEELMDKVINSETMVSFIQKLINESLRQENKEVGIL